MRKLSRVIEFLSYIGGYISGCMLLVAMFIVMVEVVTRFVLWQPITVAEELSGYILVFISYVGLAYCWKEKAHIRITFLVNKMSGKHSSWLRVGTLIMAIGYVILVSIVSYYFVVDAFHRGIRSNTLLSTPLGWPQLALPIGFTLLALQLAVEIVKTIMNIRSDISTE